MRPAEISYQFTPTLQHLHMGFPTKNYTLIRYSPAADTPEPGFPINSDPPRRLLAITNHFSNY